MSETVNIRELNELVASKSDFVKLITKGMDQTIVGQKHLVESLLIGLLADGHVLLEGVPGLAKTLAIKTLAQLIDADYSRIQFTPDLLPADVVGTMIYSQKDETFVSKKGPIFANFVLADEINRATPKTQSALLEAMEENKVSVDGETMAVPDPFMVIATQNPTGYVGTYPLPEAQLDRFALKIRMGYPSPDEELNVLLARRGKNPLDEVNPVITREELRELRAGVATINIDEELYRYIVLLIGATRRHSALALGASPRASVALMRLAQAYAFIRGRDYVLPDDIAAVFRPAIGHRLMLRQDAKLKGTSPDEILGEILRTTPVPYKGKRK